jgi:hypothetical protein
MSATSRVRGEVRAAKARNNVHGARVDHPDGRGAHARVGERSHALRNEARLNVDLIVDLRASMLNGFHRWMGMRWE